MMKTSLQLVLCVLLTPFLLSADSVMANDPAACNTAQSIRCGTNLNNQTNSGATNRLDTYSCTGRSTLSNYNGQERIYELVVNFKQQYDIRLDDVADPELNFDLFLMRDDCASGSCVLSSTNDNNIAERILAELNPGTYFLIVDTWAGEIGRYDLSVTCGPAPVLASCAGAEPLWCDELISGNTWGKSKDFNASLYNCYGGAGTYNGSDEIYAFTKSAAADHVNLHLFTESPNLNIFLVSRCDQTGFSCVAVGRDFNGGKFIDEGDIGLPAGEYYVIVDGRNSATDGAYSLLLTCNEFDFSSAEELVCGKPKEQQNFTGSTNQASLYTCSGNNQTRYDGGERLYFFDLSTPTDVRLTLDKTSTYGDLGLFLFEAGTNSPVCLDAGERLSGDDVITASLDRGRYYVVVDNIKEGFFTLSLNGCDCPIDQSLKCDEPIRGSNAGGGDDVLYTAGTCSRTPLRLDAQDRVYEFVAPESQVYEFRLTDMDRDLGIFLFENCTDPNTCIGFSNKKGDDIVSIFLEKDQLVFVAIDGIARLVTSTYTLEVVCNPITDDDGDGINNGDDNCPVIANTDQADFDGDGAGDVCDDDDDNDGVTDGLDCDPRDATIAFAIGDSCDDNNPDTQNDIINSDCMCAGTVRPDQDTDGVFDDNDNCPDVMNSGQSDFDNDGLGDACDDDDDNDGVDDDVDCDPRDATIDFAVGDSCDDGNSNTTNDAIDANCNCVGQVVGANPIQLVIGSVTAAVGDTACFDIMATEFTNVASASFSVTLDNNLAKIISITNEGLTGGTFTGSGCATIPGGTSTGSGSSTGGFVVWTADLGQSLTLGAVTPIVEVCAVILTDTEDKATVSISDLIRDVEFFDNNANELPYVAGTGQICRDTTGDTTVDPGMTISGSVMNIASIGMKDVALNLTGDRDMTALSDAQGSFELAVDNGGDFELTPEATTDMMEEVSILDVLLFRQHFIFNKSFDSPYQYIAADIDGNGRLSVRDEQLMKMRILGLETPDYPLWRFVKADHVFPEVPAFATGGEVFDFPQYADISGLDEDMTQDFIGIRMGDLQLSDLNAENRSTGRTSIYTYNRSFVAGELIEVPLQIAEQNEMAGLSVELDFDEEILEYSDVDIVLPGRIEEMVATKFLSDGKLIIQWVGDASISSDDAFEVAVITFRAKANGTLSNSIALTDEYRVSEVINTTFELSDLELDFIELPTGTFQIHPNPAQDFVLATFSNTGDQTTGSMTIYNMNGQPLVSKQVSLSKGSNQIEIRKEELGISSGIVLVELNNGSELVRQTVLFVR